MSITSGESGQSSGLDPAISKTGYFNSNASSFYLPAFCFWYSDVAMGETLVRADDETGQIIIAINMGNASRKYDGQIGDMVTLSLFKKKGYLDEYHAHRLPVSENRADYAMDSVFSDFRSVTTGGIPAGTLYRSTGPSDRNQTRAACTDRLALTLGIKSAIDVSDSKEKLAEMAKTGLPPSSNALWVPESAT